MEPQRILPRDEHRESLGELVGDILRDGQKLLEQELLLLRTEMQEQWAKVHSAVLLLGIAGIASAAAAFTLILFLVFAFAAATGLPLWASFGICAAVLSAGAVIMIFKARDSVRKVDFVPRQTVDSMKENVRWFKKRI